MEYAVLLNLERKFAALQLLLTTVGRHAASAARGPKSQGSNKRDIWGGNMKELRGGRRSGLRRILFWLDT